MPIVWWYIYSCGTECIKTFKLDKEPVDHSETIHAWLPCVKKYPLFITIVQCPILLLAASYTKLVWDRSWHQWKGSILAQWHLGFRNMEENLGHKWYTEDTRPWSIMNIYELKMARFPMAWSPKGTISTLCKNGNYRQCFLLSIKKAMLDGYNAIPWYRRK